jgi:cytochrome c oxidase cbb3-type subunit I/II
LVNTQQKAIAADLHAAGAVVEPDREIVALISYLQKLGKYEVVSPLKAAAR